MKKYKERFYKFSQYKPNPRSQSIEYIPDIRNIPQVNVKSNERIDSSYVEETIGDKSLPIFTPNTTTTEGRSKILVDRLDKKQHLKKDIGEIYNQEVGLL